MYGLTEAGPRVTAQLDEEPVGSVGKAIGNVKIAIVDNNGLLLPNDTKGIIHVCTNSRYSGYVCGDASRKSLYKNWLNTGDVGYLDNDENLFITGRIDSMFCCGSHNVYPEDIEALVNQFEGIQDNIVLGVPDDTLGTKIICCYVAKNEISKELMKYCKANLASYEIPKQFILIDKIPVTENGKKSRKLAEMYMETMR